ncbi:tail fiber assembly protein [Atlantibacter hermannii]|uniref:tail fiber assembly protein n=1 Tax=Atlantibacter hermannii TaxID=565 RepID=UPI0013EF048F|nr:tail fiber assembly protein [Atlantibacter hermannii]
MKYAIIENGVVTNIVMWDGQVEGEANPFEGLKLIQVNDEQIGIGYTVKKGNFQPPLPSKEQLVTQAMENKQHLIESVSQYVNNKQWPSKLALGRLNNEEKEAFNKWLDYLDELTKIDPSSSPDIEWPKEPQQQ